MGFQVILLSIHNEVQNICTFLFENVDSLLTMYYNVIVEFINIRGEEMNEKKLTVRTTPDIIKAIKYKCLEENISIQEYINRLVIKDLNLKQLNKGRQRPNRKEV